ncbi:amino acid-binding ACT domain protein [Methanohalobium evestigatum Z-7303]|uniref:Amino acid-binding ACT domain protein n=1 Tax=Methanohalobium evestigatum (strain ATCC BAA-1072 / DSM 3721 / NBRC 107634 / OCM 161 / Z-7303) TaxID=644295 RepID=D7E8F6_METEZ|nr:ACT domain-containing protein [Methanohalobium evestigatum]ADI73498.1 amino acid-binding ACT domain protein [Methanohalobium evestigatum Z-7303]
MDTEDNILKQISIFAENKPGRLADIADKLKNADVNIRAFNIAEAGEFGIIRMVVDNPDKAYESLHNTGFTVSETNVLGIEMEDVPGSLSNIANSLGKRGINIDYSYAFVTKTEKALLIVRVDDIKGAISVLDDASFKLVDMEEIKHL